MGVERQVPAEAVLFHDKDEEGHDRVWYKTPDGNCASTLQNAYVPTDFEDKHINQYMWAEPGIYRDFTDAGVVFTVKDERFRDPLGLEMEIRNDNLEITLHGRLFRGYTYFDYRVWHRPEVIFESHEGVETKVESGFRTLGLGRAEN